MSRGPGRWQRLILEAVSDGRWRYLVDLLPEGFTPAEYNALHRAFLRLSEERRVATAAWAFARPRVAVGPVGVPRPDRAALRLAALSVGRGPSCPSANTYEGWYHPTNRRGGAS